MLLKCSPPLKEGEVIATMPEMVVREEELISGIAFVCSICNLYPRLFIDKRVFHCAAQTKFHLRQLLPAG